MTRICIDASLVLLWLIPQKHSQQAEDIWESWRGKKVELIAPPLILAEVTSILRKRVFHGQISPEIGEELFKIFCDLNFRVVYSDDLHVEAWDLAKIFNLPKVYDMHYVALAKMEECELWTGDNRLVNATKGKFKWVKYIGDYSINK